MTHVETWRHLLIWNEYLNKQIIYVYISERMIEEKRVGRGTWIQCLLGGILSLIGDRLLGLVSDFAAVELQTIAARGRASCFGLWTTNGSRYRFSPPSLLLCSRFCAAHFLFPHLASLFPKFSTLLIYFFLWIINRFMYISFVIFSDCCGWQTTVVSLGRPGHKTVARNIMNL